MADANKTEGQFIKCVSSQNTGGGCMVDFIELHDGRLIGLNDECIVLYPSVDAFYDGDENGEFDEFAMIYRPDAVTQIEKPSLGTYTERLMVEHTVDLLVLDTNEVLGVSGENVCLYASLDDVFNASPDVSPLTISLLEKPKKHRPK